MVVINLPSVQSQIFRVPSDEAVMIWRGLRGEMENAVTGWVWASASRDDVDDEGYEEVDGGGRVEIILYSGATEEWIIIEDPFALK